MIKKYFTILFVIQLLQGIGLEALNIPSSALSASLTGAGIASSKDIWANPASIFMIQKKSIRFSGYNWLGHVPGNEISIFWIKNNKPSYISLQSSNIDDIELYGDNPSDEQPIGTFSTSWVAGSYCTGFKLYDFQISNLIKVNFSKLYNEIMYGFTTDFGFRYIISKKMKFGFSIKNVGYEHSNKLKNSLPTQYGIGFSFLEPLLNSSIMLDFIQDNNNGSIMKFGFNASANSMTYNLGITKNNEVLIYGFGCSYRYKQWGTNIGLITHNNTVFDISKYLDIIWYF